MKASKAKRAGSGRRGGPPASTPGSLRNETAPTVRRTVEVFAQITAVSRCLELARRTADYLGRNGAGIIPGRMVERIPELPKILQRMADEQSRLLAVDLFRRILAEIPEDGPVALRKRVDVFDTTFGLGINEGKANATIASQRYGISREAWEQAQDRLCRSLGITRPITRNSRQDTTKNRLRNFRHAKKL